MLGDLMERYREEVINLRFADVLREMGFKASGETISKGKLPDVMVTVEGLKINIEGRFKSSPLITKLKEKCRERIEDGICSIAIGVIYPENLREAQNDARLITKIKRSVFDAFLLHTTSAGINELSFSSVKIEDLALELNHLYGVVITNDILKEQITKVNKAINETSSIASMSGLFFESEVVIEKLKEILGLKHLKLKKSKKKSFNKDILQIGLFIIFDALVFHEILSATQHGIGSLKDVPDARISSFLKTEWEKIIKINYLPIFDLAKTVCINLPTAPEMDRILKILIETALDVVCSGVLLKHDLMGRIYHKLLLKTTGKHYATYYTSIPAATLLANLTIKTKNPDTAWDFSKLENLEEFGIIDPACGSGTLLSSAYTALKDKYILDRYNSDSPSLLDLGKYHKLMLEDILKGWDVLDYAGHLTLTTLALHNTKTTFRHSNIYTLRIGIIDKQIYLGSLDILDPEILMVGKGFRSFATRKKMVGDRDEEIKITQNSQNIVTMNPPFSRSAGTVNIKFGYEEKDIINKMNKHLRDLGRKLAFTGIGQAGLGAYFVLLGNMLLRQSGRLALVLPRAVLSGVSWKKIREDLLLRQYEIEYIVSNYDPGDKESGIEPWNFSENTDLGEVLIVARKTKMPARSKYTTFINLWNKPANEPVGIKICSIASKMRFQKKLKYLEGDTYSTLKLNEKDIGTTYNVSQELLKYNFLAPCLFAHPELNKFVFSLIGNNLMPLIPISRISKKLGVDRKQVETSFTLVKHKTSFPVLWGHPLSIDKVALSKTDFAKPIDDTAIDKYKLSCAKLLVAERVWTNTLNIVSLYTEKPLLATMFWEVDVNDEHAKILSLWFNSTFGLILLLSKAINNKGTWFNLKKSQLTTLPILDIKSLSKNKKRDIISFFKEIKKETFVSIPEEFKSAANGKGVRKKIDDIFCKAMNLKIKLEHYYDMLAKDPIITNERI